MITKFFLSKKKLYWIIFLSALFGIIFSLTMDLITNNYDLKYFYYMFTYQSNTIVILFYLLLIINFKEKYRNLNFINNKKLKTAISSYMGLILLTVFLVFGPMEIFEYFGYGNGSLTDFPPINGENSETNVWIIIGIIIQNLFIHFLVPILVILDVYFMKKKSNYNTLNFLLTSIYPLAFLINAYIVGSLTNIYPYLALDPNIYPIYFILIIVALLTIFYCISYLFSIKNSKLINLNNEINSL